MRHTSSGGFPYRLATTRLGVVVEEGQRFESRECGETFGIRLDCSGVIGEQSD
jgi:hypothetical protein